MSSQPSRLSLNEYMDTSYSPDCEYVDGLLVERNVGKFKHSYTQGKVFRRLDESLDGTGLFVLTEQRLRVGPTRVRIPDVCVVGQTDEITIDPPHLCVEILSPDDRWSRLTASISDYQELGVPCVWVINPFQRRAWLFNLDEPPMEVTDGMLRTAGLHVNVALSDVLPPQE